MKRKFDNLKLPDHLRSTIKSSLNALRAEMKFGRKEKLFDTLVVRCTLSKVDDFDIEDI